MSLNENEKNVAGSNESSGSAAYRERHKRMLDDLRFDKKSCNQYEAALNNLAGLTYMAASGQGNQPLLVQHYWNLCKALEVFWEALGDSDDSSPPATTSKESETPSVIEMLECLETAQQVRKAQMVRDVWSSMTSGQTD